MKRLQGSLLVASPHLPDPNFFRSVVFMIEHESEGALGLILNRVTNTTLKTIWAALEEREIENEQFLHVGGPVEGPLMALHALTPIWKAWKSFPMSSSLRIRIRFVR